MESQHSRHWAAAAKSKPQSKLKLKPQPQPQPQSELMTPSDVASMFRISTAALRVMMSRGQLGKEHGLIYVRSKPYFLADVLRHQIRSGELGRKRSSKKAR